MWRRIRLHLGAAPSPQLELHCEVQREDLTVPGLDMNLKGNKTRRNRNSRFFFHNAELDQSALRSICRPLFAIIIERLVRRSNAPNGI